ncbi:MAG: helix-turn-helix transcriptional regulator [Patescibacteria group bacterium]|nr:helix-turn-helix transcriptional regulator [Patescibacteria group bacterium]
MTVLRTRAAVLRYEKGVSVSAVARGTGLSRATVTAAEGGQPISARVAKALADFYGVPVTDLVRVEDHHASRAA